MIEVGDSLGGGGQLAAGEASSQRDAATWRFSLMLIKAISWTVRQAQAAHHALIGESGEIVARLLMGRIGHDLMLSFTARCAPQVSGAQTCVVPGDPIFSRAFRRIQPIKGIQGFDMKTISAKPESVKRDWYLVDATNKTLGRLSTELARRLKGKHKPIYAPHMDVGDFVIVINASKVSLSGTKKTTKMAYTGNKLNDKMYHRFTGYIGNLKTTPLKDLLAKHPERVIEIAVKGMLPKNPLGRAMYRKLKVYAGPNHPHTAQQPQVLDI